MKQLDYIQADEMYCEFVDDMVDAGTVSSAICIQQTWRKIWLRDFKDMRVREFVNVDR